MKRRTNIDFTKHKVEVIQHEGVLIHKFKRPDTMNCAITFINTCGVLSVTGDFGNWIFCREFHPSGNTSEGVSDGYWDEKLQILSQQKAKIYDSEETTKAINEFKDTFNDSYGREMNEEESDWVESLENDVDDEHEYTHTAYRCKPADIDYESVPFGKKRHFWLSAIYDGFEETCKQLKDEQKDS